MADFTLDELKKYLGFLDSNKEPEKLASSLPAEDEYGLPPSITDYKPSAVSVPVVPVKTEKSAKEQLSDLNRSLTGTDQISSRMPEKPKTREEELQALLKAIPGAGTAPEASTKPRPSSKKPEEEEQTQSSKELEIENQPNFYDLLGQAKQSRDSQILMANLAKAAETLGSGISGMVSRGTVTKPVGTDFYDKLMKQAEQRVEDIGTAYTMKTKQDEMERFARRRSPDSAESQIARDIYKELIGRDAPKNLTAEVFEKYAPQYTSIQRAREEAKARQEERAQKQLDRDLLRQKGYDEKKEKAIINAREEVTSKGYKNAFDMYRNAERIANTFENLSPDLYGDSIRTLQSAKLFQGDSSVVRGPELKEVQNAVGILDRLKNEVSRLGGVSKLSQKQRDSILNAVNTIKRVSKKEYLGLLEPAVKQYKRRGLPLEEIFDSNVLSEIGEKPLGTDEDSGLPVYNPVSKPKP